MKPKTKTVYIWRGIDCVTFMRGTNLERYETSGGIYYRGVMRHRGIGRKPFTVNNIPEHLIGQPKKLCVQDNLIGGWEVIEINANSMGGETYTSEVNNSVLVTLTKERNEKNMWKAKYFDLLRKVQYSNQEDRFQDEMLKRVKHVGQLRKHLYSDPFGSYMGMGGGSIGGQPGFGQRWGVGGGGGGGQPGFEGEGTE